MKILVIIIFAAATFLCGFFSTRLMLRTFCEKDKRSKRLYFLSHLIYFGGGVILVLGPLFFLEKYADFVIIITAIDFAVFYASSFICGAVDIHKRY